MIEAVIFDMDGLLIDSEPFWKTAEKEVFGSLGIEVNDQHTFLTSRMTTREVTEYWFAVKPWNGKSQAAVEQEVINRVGELIGLYGKSMPGVEGTLQYIKASGLKIGLATNSPHSLIPRVLEKLNIKRYFDAVLSADFVDQGKPSPEIYLKTASVLSVDPSRCIVFEDSSSGVSAAIAAGMTVIAVPAESLYTDSGFDRAHLKIQSLSYFSERHKEILKTGITV